MPSSACPPWKMAPLDEWSIVGMNHYHVGKERRLFVAMTNGDRCIVEEGPDDAFLWNRLWHKAVAIREDAARLARAAKSPESRL